MHMSNKEKAYLIGGIVGMILGAGTVWLLMNFPEETPKDESKPITGGDVLNITKTAASLIRGLDDFRYRL
ncbi:MAG: hypothetical protein B6242_01350 [Anaerolineaceae bacterium 4572_78]|nr:MAG: hypothetical protein B6242_01350 [Anaerolineaceae bacterium 4572_78]